ncbi:MAG: hypothetical protein ACLQDQ_02895 [Myxococcaceae bacterium]
MRRFDKATAAFLAALALALVGCGGISASTRRYPDAPSYAPTDASSVEILRSDPSIPFVKLGEVTLSLQSNPSQQEIASALAKQAAAMGATAVVLVYDGSARMGVMYSGSLWAPVDSSQANQPVLIAVAIRYT